MKTPICKDCHHAPSGRTAEYGAACQCSCHDVADAAPALLEALQAMLEANYMPASGHKLAVAARAAIALTRSH